MWTPYHARRRRPPYFVVHVYFGKEGTGGFEHSWSERWFTHSAISYRSFVARCTRSLMANHPNTVLEDFRLILNVRTESYEQITAANIRAVMRELQSCQERRMIFPVYLKIRPSVETSSNSIVSVEE
ncbi:hypothetical protein H4I96_05558 [Botrytis cinerea]